MLQIYWLAINRLIFYRMSIVADCDCLMMDGRWHEFFNFKFFNVVSKSDFCNKTDFINRLCRLSFQFFTYRLSFGDETTNLKNKSLQFLTLLSEHNFLLKSTLPTNYQPEYIYIYIYSFIWNTQEYVSCSSRLILGRDKKKRNEWPTKEHHATVVRAV